MRVIAAMRQKTGAGVGVGANFRPPRDSCGTPGGNFY